MAEAPKDSPGTPPPDPDRLEAALRSAQAELAELRDEMARRSAASQAAVRSLAETVGTLASQARAADSVEQALHRTSRQLDATSEALEEANAALQLANRDLDRRIAERTAELAIANAALQRSEARLQAALEAGRLGVWELDLEHDQAERSPLHDRIFGYEEPLPRWGYRSLLRHVLAEDRRRVHLGFREAIQSGSGRLHMECRIRRAGDGEVRWIEGFANALRAPDGHVTHLIGVIADITDRKRAEERAALLLGELGHRVKNTLATVQSVALQTWRSVDTPAEMRERLDSRLRALARAHDLLHQATWEGASLREVTERTLAAYGADRLRIAGAPVRLTPSAVVTINLAFHELATNAAKYGALSCPTGLVEVRWTHDAPAPPPAGEPRLHILWRERGGPPVQPPARRGFGSRLLERGLAQEFGGSVVLDFVPAGLECRMDLPLDRITARTEPGAD
ncbi:PAS domain-containing protein [Roseomonas sp. NAR14]|uniref:histidine kinase n=1 Tax=Roseomonas acroporae TaxID=2937791 RepID=A0A9X2BT41_9PROT|nr:HWE histidine kinase domain-containing protein [Roseomonas acroporae]MCK8782906.1 PAS domain-containing protein [Roseomonas acroporae]